MPLEKPFMDLLSIELCTIPGVCVTRRNVGTIPIVNAITGRRRAFRAGPPKGAADLWGIFRHPALNLGLHFEVETKAPGRKQSVDQVRWQRHMERHGALYFLAPQHPHLEARPSAIQWRDTIHQRLLACYPRS